MRMTRAAATVAVAALTAGGIITAATAVSAAPHPKPDATRLSISNKVIAHARQRERQRKWERKWERRRKWQPKRARQQIVLSP